MNTKRIIKEAAYRLFETRPIEQITVQNILDEAGVSRRTFYDHFTDKYELINDYFTECIAETIFHPDALPEKVSTEEWIRFTEAYFSLMKTRIAYYKNRHHNKSVQFLWECINRNGYSYCKNARLKRTGAESLTETEDLTIKAFMAGVFRVLQAFLEDESSLSEKELVDIIISIIPEDYRTY